MALAGFKPQIEKIVKSIKDEISATIEEVEKEIALTYNRSGYKEIHILTEA